MSADPNDPKGAPGPPWPPGSPECYGIVSTGVALPFGFAF